MLDGLVPLDVVRRRRGEIYEVMGELAGIVVEEDTSSWPHCRTQCLAYAYISFDSLSLVDTKLMPELTKLVRTWEPRRDD